MLSNNPSTPDSDKTRYREACAKRSDVPLFCRPEWLDAAVGNAYWRSPLISDTTGAPLAALPLVVWQKAGADFVSDTIFVPYLCPVYLGAQTREVNEIELRALLQKAGIRHQYRIPLYPHGATAWPAWIHAGFKLQTKYTHIVHSSNLNESYYKENVRREVKKAKKTLIVREATEVTAALQLMNANKRGKKINTGHAGEMLNACMAAKSGVLLEAITDTGIPVSFIWLATDKNFRITYYLLGATHPDFKSSGASSLLLHTAIADYTPPGGIFNFLGSSIPSIHHFFSRFGTTVIPVTVAKRFHGWPRLAAKLKELFKF